MARIIICKLCSEQSVSCGYCLNHYKVEILEKFDGYIKYMQTRRMKTTNLYLYVLSHIGKEKLDALNKSSDLHELYIYITQQEGKTKYSFIKNYRVFYYALKTYLKYRGKYDLAMYIPKEGIKQKKNKSVTKHFPKDIVDKFVAYAGFNYTNRGMINNKPNQESERDTLTIKALFKSGFRITEFLSTTAAQYKVPTNIITVSNIWGKRGKREILITPDLKQEIVAYIEKYNIKDNDYVFTFNPNINEKRKESWALLGTTVPLKRTYSEYYYVYRQSQKVRQMMTNLSKLLLKNKSLTPHKLRHSFAMYLKHNKKWSIEDIQVALGHASIQTTADEYARTTIADIKDKYMEEMIEHEKNNA